MRFSFGLSRQMSLSHQIDIIANNIANIDTTGFKADTAAFSEYLGSGASDMRSLFVVVAVRFRMQLGGFLMMRRW